MKFHQRVFIGIIVLAFVFIHQASAQLYSLQTRNMRLVYYSKAHEYLVPHIARCFENALRFHSNLFSYTPPEPVTVILQDFGDYASGGANTVPFHLMSLGIAPFSYVYETMPPIERMNMMLNHEFAHVVTMEKTSPRDRFFRSAFFGRVTPIPDAPLSIGYSYLTSPRWSSPRWFIEGIAVFLETWMGGGLGRALSAYDEMVFRTMVRDSAFFYDPVGLESEGTKVDFQVGTNAYLYGTRFVSYLALKYGPDKLLSWFNQSDQSKSYYASQFENVYGLSLDDAWSQWISWEHEWQQMNLDSLRMFPITPVRSLYKHPLGSVSRAFLDSSNGRLLMAVNYPGRSPHIAALNLHDGSIEALQSIRGGAIFYVTSLAYDPLTETLFYTTDNDRLRDLNALNLRTGENRLLQHDARIGDFAFNRADSSLWGVRHYHGISTLVRIPYPYDEWDQVLSWDYGTDMFDLDVSPDGKQLSASLSFVDGRQILIAMNTTAVLHGDTTYEMLYDFENSTPSNFVFSEDGRYLFGTSFYSGVSNVVRYDVMNRKMEWMTNGETGFFHPLPISNDSLIAFHYRAGGFEPVVIPQATTEDVNPIHYLGQEVVEQYPELKSWRLPPPAAHSINLDSLTISDSEYNPMSHIRLASIYPVVEGYKDFAAYGLRMNLGEAIGLHTIDLTASYTPNSIVPADERLHFSLNYKFWGWQISASRNGADFYDLFGPTKISRKGNSLALSYTSYLIYDEPEVMDFSLSLAGYNGLERLPEFQNVVSSFDRFLVLSGRLTHRNIGFTIGAADAEYGTRWEMGSNSTLVKAKIFPTFSVSADYGFLLPIDHSSIWLRGSAGFSPSRREEPFANFFFGGFRNNWIDHREAKRYRDMYSFPGIEIDEAGGTRFGKGLVEWTLPPLRFRKVGGQLLYLTWMRTAFFTSALSTNFDDSSLRRTRYNVGGQTDFKFIFFSNLESTFSIGYAIAMERERRPSDEFMVSLKILR